MTPMLMSPKKFKDKKQALGQIYIKWKTKENTKYSNNRIDG